ncbi:MarR family transcriptional regulator [Microbacterium saccharophilum]|uniref:MarR family transcriptional regulator n=1 Tax=Microbacterium saccharophilum TaxID=1213358 RepID=UPI0027D946A0|nr:MarR family transcriptional regulator [Microbacterium saccharophilum]
MRRVTTRRSAGRSGQILAVLGEDRSSPCNTTYLADRLVDSRSGLTSQIRRLEKAGLVARAASPEDHRGVNVSLTSASAALRPSQRRGRTLA